MSDIEKHVYPTIESIKEWQRKIENYSGFECINIRDLKKDANHDEYIEAKMKDGAWFEGFVNDLALLI